MPDLGRALRARPFAFALVLAVALLAVNTILDPSFVSSDALRASALGFAPFAIVAMASTPAILSGGIDLSIGPIVTFANVMMVSVLLPAGLGDAWISVSIVVVLGAAIGAASGALVALLRFPAVIATLCALFVLDGVSRKITETPEVAASNWTDELSATVGPVPVILLVVAAPLVVWALLGRTPFLRALYSVGGDDATAFTAGINVAATRIVGYALGGMFAALAGLALTGLIRSADPTLGLQYTLIALAAVALGGTQFGGGRGSLVGAFLGAACIYLIQSVLSEVNVSTLWLQIVYGGVLVGAVVLGARVHRGGRTAVAG
jgi:ribose transport system permease protein